MKFLDRNDLQDVGKFDVGMDLVQLRYRVTKGDRCSNHGVSLEGRIHGPPFATDALYWFGLHLLKRFDLDLTNFHHWNLSDDMKSQSLWGLSADAMRE